MPTPLWRMLAFLAIALSLVLVVGELAHSGPGGDFGLTARPIGGDEFTVNAVATRSPAARAGMKVGDRIAPAGGALADRLELLYPVAAPGATLSITVRENGSTRRVALRADTPTLSLSATAGLYALTCVLEGMRVLFFLVAAAIVARRSEAGEARALATFLVAFGLGTLARWPWYPPEIAAALMIVRPMAVTFALAQAIRFATLFPKPSVRGPRRALARVNNIVAFAAPGIVGVLELLSVLGTPWTEGITSLANGLLIAWLLYVIAALGIGFWIAARETDPADRERLRWVTASLSIGLCGLVVAAALQSAGASEFVSIPFVFAIGAIPLGTAYAILRYRLLEIGFVVNRALVFATISAIVVAAFSLLEFVLGRYLTTLGHLQSALLEALLALAVGVSLGRIHARVEKVVDTIFFRERHRAEAALRRLAREAAYYDEPQTLATRVIAALERHANARGAAVYLHDGNGAYVAMHATLTPAEAVDRNDAAVVRMRASGEAVDLDELASEVVPTMFPGRIVFPMIVRGTLTGALACGEKSNLETYAPDERATLGELAHASGLAFDTMATRTLRDTIERVIAGEVGIEDLRRLRLPPSA